MVDPEYLNERMDYADWLALRARAAAAAGDEEQAHKLRSEYDRLYDELEASLPEAQDG